MASLPNLSSGTDFYEICAALGYVVTKWEHVEARLFASLLLLCNDSDQPIVEEYRASLGFRTRTDLLRRALQETGTSAALSSEMDQQLRKLERLSIKRNKVVHGTLCDERGTVVFKKKTVEHRGLVIQPSIYGPKQQVLNSRYSYGARDLFRLGNSFHAARLRWNEFFDKVDDELGLSANFGERVLSGG